MNIKKTLHRIIFISIPSILVTLVVLEIGLRTAGNLYCSNYIGSVPGNLKENKLSILCLGDSFTVGAGASTRNSYPRQLERLLRENIGKDIKVINAGRMGNTSSLLLKNFEKDIALYRPKIVIVMIGCNNSWNFEDSSYFKLYKEKVGCFEKIDGILSRLRIYKLIKIGYLGFKNSKIKEPGIVRDNISNESLRLSALGAELFMEGRFDPAEDKLKEALISDKNNYIAHLWLAHIYNARSEFKEGREELWKAIRTIGEWNDELIYDVICRIPEQNDFRIIEKELSEIKRYIEARYSKDSGKRASLVRLIDAKLDFSEDKQIPRRVLEYDLGQIVSLAKSKGIILILQTYPHDGSSLYDVCQRISGLFNIPLVDNFSAFKEIEKNSNINDFFAPDKHCNDNGYRIIAENTYDTLCARNLLSNVERPN